MHLVNIVIFDNNNNINYCPMATELQISTLEFRNQLYKYYNIIYVKYVQ